MWAQSLPIYKGLRQSAPIEGTIVLTTLALMKRPEQSSTTQDENPQVRKEAEALESDNQDSMSKSPSLLQDLIFFIAISVEIRLVLLKFAGLKIE
ncbi:hypothetical protein RND71_015524 [Anisodus tanguticus]|uniref:Uncharacterized protein n=1 Tax=Anisodus tanguticus TaxID=243964 RepID=A0AAE1VHS0_9SOLA|nr:hypothetical protein RND71_015524 [Anisodus tanguticus]